MKASNNPHLTFILFGVWSLYYSINKYLETGESLYFLGIALGMAAGFFGLSKIGDEKTNHSQYRSRPKNPTHIGSIPDKEYTGEAHGTTVMDEQAVQTIRELVSSGRIIDAIKIYRRVTGHGLRESKDYIDQVVREIEEERRAK
jgi:ribosomal protein L7/L12